MTNQEINKAVMFLKQKDFTSAVETLKAFEKQVKILFIYYNQTFNINETGFYSEN